MTFKNKQGEVSTSTIIYVILGVVVLVWAFWGPITKLIKGGETIDNQTTNLCEQAGGECLAVCDGSRTQLSGTNTCTQGPDPSDATKKIDRVCCTKLAS